MLPKQCAHQQQPAQFPGRGVDGNGFRVDEEKMSWPDRECAVIRAGWITVV
jgi:hypothetical protein